MATFKEGIPDTPQEIPNFAQDFCLMNGGTQAGVAGLYPLDTQRCYYFFGFPIAQVRRIAPQNAACLSQNTSCKSVMLSCRLSEVPLQHPVAHCKSHKAF